MQMFQILETLSSPWTFATRHGIQPRPGTPRSGGVAAGCGQPRTRAYRTDVCRKSTCARCPAETTRDTPAHRAATCGT
eukprot:2843880-Prymnesium_polylepis.1